MVFLFFFLESFSKTLCPGREVEFLEDFISHDWLTSRWAKLCALMVAWSSDGKFSLVFSVFLVLKVF